MGLRYLIAPAATGLSAALPRDWLGWNREFFLNHPGASVWVFACVAVQIFFWLVIIRWLSGGLYPLPEIWKPANQPVSSTEDLTQHPTQNRKEITLFVVLIALTAAAVYGLACVPRYETLAIYVAGLAPALGVPILLYFRRVRCPQCRRAMRRVRTARIQGQKWGVYRCADSHGEWRVEESPRPGRWSS